MRHTVLLDAGGWCLGVEINTARGDFHHVFLLEDEHFIFAASHILALLGLLLAVCRAGF